MKMSRPWSLATPAETNFDISNKVLTAGKCVFFFCANTICNYAFIGASAVITKNVSYYALVFGNPARHLENYQHG